MATTTSVDRKWARELAQSLNWFAELRFGENCLRTLRTVADEACDKFKRTGEFHGEQLNELLRHDLTSLARNHYHKITSLARGRRSELAEVFGSVDFANEFQSALLKLAVNRLVSDEDATPPWFSTMLAVKNAALSGSWWGENNPIHKFPVPIPPHDEITAAFDVLREAGRRANDYLAASIVGGRTGEGVAIPALEPRRDEEPSREANDVPDPNGAGRWGIELAHGGYTYLGRFQKLKGKARLLLVEFLETRDGRLSVQELLDSPVWKDTHVSGKAVNVQVSNLRASLRGAYGLGDAFEPLECIDQGRSRAWKLRSPMQST